MRERRRNPRNRVYYGGLLAYGARTSTLACIVRDFNLSGAKVELEGIELLPDEVDFEIEHKHLSCRARLIWRDRGAAGFAFCSPNGFGEVVPLAWARRLRAAERRNAQLASRIEQLSSER